MVKIDENYRAKLLAEGYEEDVIEFLVMDKFNAMREEFLEKNVILNRYYTKKSYVEFMDEVFPGLEKYMVITGDAGYQEMDLNELMDYQADKDNVYVVPASFINGCYNGSTCRNIYALVVDVDKIKPQTLKTIIDNGNLGKNIPMPSYIVNSGSGVHLYYVFKEKVPYYWKNRQILNAMYRVLCGITRKRIAAKTDWHAIVQPFRMPGSLTKLGQIATAYQSSDKWTVKELCHRLGVDCSEIDLVERPLQSQDDYKKWKQEQAALGNKPKKTKRKFVPQKSSTGFYEHCLKRCFEDTQEGNRYMSMVGLSVVAVKKGVEKERLESDLRELLKHYNEIGSVITVKEMQKAMRAYNVKALKCPPATLEAWFGWNFRRNRTESKGRTREEHLKRARLLQTADYPNGEWRNKEGAPTKEQQVKAWRQAHPDGKPKECMQDTGISKNTVYKWWNSL